MMERQPIGPVLVKRSSSLESAPALMKPLEVAAMLQMSRPMVYKLIRLGKIPACRVGGTWRFHRDEFIYWLSQWARSGERLSTNDSTLEDRRALVPRSIRGQSKEPAP